MIALDSRSITVSSTQNLYVTSGPQDDSWGQPPASHYVLFVRDNHLMGELIAGVYAASPSTEAHHKQTRLAAEFAAWESASDEAILNFEKGLN